MGFTDALKRSLGFEEDTSLHNKQQNNYRRPSTPSSDFRMSNNNASDLSSHSYYDDVSISPEQSFYEIMLIRPKTIDDINYVVDQVLEESNPVILDLSFLEKESPANFKLAGEKIKVLDYPDGTLAFLYGHRSLKCQAFDKLACVDQGQIVDNKRLGTVLQLAQVKQDERESEGKRERSKKSPSRKAQVRIQEQLRAINPVLADPSLFVASSKR